MGTRIVQIVLTYPDGAQAPEDLDGIVQDGTFAYPSGVTAEVTTLHEEGRALWGQLNAAAQVTSTPAPELPWVEKGAPLSGPAVDALKAMWPHAVRVASWRALTATRQALVSQKRQAQLATALLPALRQLTWHLKRGEGGFWQLVPVNERIGDHLIELVRLVWWGQRNMDLRGQSFPLPGSRLILYGQDGHAKLVLPAGDDPLQMVNTAVDLGLPMQIDLLQNEIDRAVERLASLRAIQTRVNNQGKP